MQRPPPSSVTRSKCKHKPDYSSNEILCLAENKLLNLLHHCLLIGLVCRVISKPLIPEDIYLNWLVREMFYLPPFIFDLTFPFSWTQTTTFLSVYESVVLDNKNKLVFFKFILNLSSIVFICITFLAPNQYNFSSHFHLPCLPSAAQELGYRNFGFSVYQHFKIIIRSYGKHLIIDLCDPFPTEMGR